MPTTRQTSDGEISVLALASTLVRHRGTILRWVLFGAVVAVLPPLLMKRTWSVSASFVPQGTDAAQSGLRNLAGQFGVVLPGGASSAQSPDFYADLIEAQAILGPIADDTVSVADGEPPRTVSDLLDVEESEPLKRRDETIRALREAMSSGVTRTTGVVTVNVRTHYARLSLAIAQRALDGLNRFNLQTRQEQAAAERRFVESRLDAQRRTLAAAEDRLGNFLQNNRQFRNSPDLTFEHERLQREVSLQQQVLVGLAQSHEEARIREVRDVPILSVVEAPTLPVQPNRRGTVLYGIGGIFAGLLLGVVAAFSREMVARRRAEGDEEVAELGQLLKEARSDVTRWVRKPRAGSG